MTADAFARHIRAKGLAVAPGVLAFHEGPVPRHQDGWAEVTGGNRLARLIARLAGFPAPADRVPFSLTVEAGRDGALVWTRRFGPSVTRSVLQTDAAGHVVETFGPVRLRLALSAKDGALVVAVAGARLLGVPLPRWLTPVSRSREYMCDEGVGFDISAHLQGLGLLVRYRGIILARPG